MNAQYGITALLIGHENQEVGPASVHSGVSSLAHGIVAALKAGFARTVKRSRTGPAVPGDETILLNPLDAGTLES